MQILLIDSVRSSEQLIIIILLILFIFKILRAFKFHGSEAALIYLFIKLTNGFKLWEKSLHQYDYLKYFIYSTFIRQMFIEYLLRIKHSSRYWGYKNE